MRYDRAPCHGDPMFSTLLGALPTIRSASRRTAGDEADARLDDVAALAAAGLELVSDGGRRRPCRTRHDRDRGRALAGGRRRPARSGQGRAARSVLGARARRVGSGRSRPPSGSGPPSSRSPRPGARSSRSPSPTPLAIATDPAAAAAFAAAHRRLVDGTEGIHASLALTGGNVDGMPAGHCSSTCRMRATRST